MKLRLCVYLQLLPVIGRKPLRPLGSVPFRKLSTLVDDMYQVLYQWRISTFQELSDEIYCAAKVITDDCSPSVYKVYQPPKWRQ